MATIATLTQTAVGGCFFWQRSWTVSIAYKLFVYKFSLYGEMFC